MGTVRTLIGYVKGPKGDKGDTGATGPQGPAGQDGAPGVSDYATTEAAGLVRVGDDFKINSSNGTLSIKNLFTTASTLAKMVSEEAFAISLGKIAKAVDWVVDNAPNFFNKNTDIVDGFDSALTDKALSANAGKTLKTSIDSLNDSLNGLKVRYLNFGDTTTPTITFTNYALLAIGRDTNAKLVLFSLNGAVQLVGTDPAISWTLTDNNRTITLSNSQGIFRQGVILYN